MSFDIEVRARIAVLERCLGNIAQIATLTLNAGAIPPAADASPAVAPTTSSTVPPEAQGTPLREGDAQGDYTYHRCPSCSQMKPYKKWWPRAKCWECFKAGKP